MKTSPSDHEKTLECPRIRGAPRVFAERLEKATFIHVREIRPGEGVEHKSKGINNLQITG